MARITLNAEQIAALETVVENTDLLAEDMIALTTSVAEWIAEHGEPTKRLGAILVFDHTRLVPIGKGDRTCRAGTVIYVAPLPFTYDGREVTATLVERV